MSPFILQIAAFVMLMVFLGSALSTLRGYAFYRRAPQMSPVDMSHLSAKPPEAVLETLSKLTALGFRRVGEA